VEKMIYNNLPNNWMAVDFGDIFNFEKKSKHKASEGKENGKNMYFTSSNSLSKSVDFFDFDGEYLIFGTGGNASIHCPNGKFSTSGDCLVAKINNTKVLTKYVYRYLTANMYLLEAGFKGAGLKHISKTYIQNIKIPYPENVEVQKKIAAILEKAERLKEWRKEADRLTDEFLKSTFLEMFGDPIKNPKKWEIKNLKKISVKFSDGPFGSNLKTEHYNNFGIRVIRLQNIGINKFLDEDRAYISEKHFSKLKKHTCLPGDVIIGTMGSPNIKACIIPQSIEIALNKADCIQCRPDKNLANSEYICHLLNLPSILQMASKLIHGQTRSRVSMGNLSSFNVPVPPLTFQNQFSEIVQKVEILQEKQFQSRQNINHLFNSLMQQAFKGELAC
jgi:type I restriction enzyme S subunit